MGRYYNTDTGRGGKFGFGCQNSTDPGDYFGMEESERTSIDYYAEGDSVPHITKQMDKIYDEAGVPKENRMYDLCDGVKYEQFYNRLHKYFFEKCNAGEGYFAGEDGGTEREKFNDAYLCQSRLWLGLIILTDIKENGYCSLEAEL